MYINISLYRLEYTLSFNNKLESQSLDIEIIFLIVLNAAYYIILINVLRNSKAYSMLTISKQNKRVPVRSKQPNCVISFLLQAYLKYGVTALFLYNTM